MRGKGQPGRPALFVAPLAAAGFLIAFGGLHYGFYARQQLIDTPIYERYGDAIVHLHELPYRDFAVEYPPGALPAFAAPSLVARAGDFPRYRQVFEALMLVCGAAASALVGLILVRQHARPPRLVAGTLLAGLAPLALGPVVLSRFDLWPAALTIGALTALVTERRRLAFGLLAVAIVAKLYAAVILPLALVFVWRRAGRREAGICAAAMLAVGAVSILPFAVAAPHGIWLSFWRQANRPLQIESLGASFLLAAHQLWSTPLTEVASHGSDNLVGHAPHLLAVAQSLVGAVALGAIWIGFSRGPAERDRLLRYAAAAVCAFVALDKVLSPQYLIWLIALVPLVRGGRGLVASALFAAAAILTQLWFPRHYIALVYLLDPRASWLVLARDLALVALLLTLVWPFERRLRFGSAVVGAIVAAGSAAAVMAAVSTTPATAPSHSGLLNETGVASSCARANPSPESSPGTVRFDSSVFGNPDDAARCVRVTLTTRPDVQLFSAAYRGRFDTANPRLHYLADAGRCTNIVAVAAGSTLGYSFTVRAGERFVVEVEACGAGITSLPYTIEVGDRARPPAGFADAVAAAHGNRVVVSWRTTGEAPGLRLAVYREQAGVKVRLGRPVRRGRSAAAAAYSLTDSLPPRAGSYRYWIRARLPDGTWSWYGPIALRR